MTVILVLAFQIDFARNAHASGNDLTMGQFVFGQGGCCRADFVADIALVLSAIHRVHFHVVFQLGARLASLVAVGAV